MNTVLGRLGGAGPAAATGDEEQAAPNESAPSVSFIATSPTLKPSKAAGASPNLLATPLQELDPKTQRFSALEPDYNDVPTYPIRPSYREFHSKLQPKSKMVQFDGAPDDPYRPASVPVYLTATFEQPSSTEFGAYDYTRSGNPTRTALECQIAMLENAHAAFAFTSGMAALNAVTRLCAKGDTLLLGSDIYGGMHRLCMRVTAVLGVTVIPIHTWDLKSVREALMDPRVTLIHMETPSNPLMRVTNMRALADVCAQVNKERPRGRPKVWLSVDSTMMTPYLQQPINHGADIVVHSMTKFIGGTSDAMGGIVCVASEELAKRIAFYQNAEGTGLSPFDSWLFLRGVKTLALRVTQQQANAEQIARFLTGHVVVSGKHRYVLGKSTLPQHVYYAGLNPAENTLEPDRDERGSDSLEARTYNYTNHFLQASGGGSVISFTTGSVNLSRRIVDALVLFKLTVSFGSVNSLCEMPATLSHASIPAHERSIPDDLVRLSIGIEDVSDLLQDLQRAFDLARSSAPEELIKKNRGGPLLHGLPHQSNEVYKAPDLNDAVDFPIDVAKPAFVREPSTMHTSDRTKPELPARVEQGSGFFGPQSAVAMTSLVSFLAGVSMALTAAAFFSADASKPLRAVFR